MVEIAEDGLVISPSPSHLPTCNTLTHTHPHTLTQAWEEKHVTVPLGHDGFAGFSVVGGRDQPQLPNPGAFIITTVIPNGPADGLLR